MFQLHTFEFDNEIAMIQRITEMLKSMHVADNETAFFENVVFCGDRKEYEGPLKELAQKGNKSVTLIKDHGYSEMEIHMTNFDVGHLVGMCLGLKASEL